MFHLLQVICAFSIDNIKYLPADGKNHIDKRGSLDDIHVFQKEITTLAVVNWKSLCWSLMNLIQETEQIQIFDSIQDQYAWALLEWSPEQGGI